MTTKKRKKQKSGRPKNWQEICMERVPPGVEKPSEPEKAEDLPEPPED